MTTLDEALRALEKELRVDALSDERRAGYETAEAVAFRYCANKISALLSSRQEVAPVAWMRDGATTVMHNVRFDKPGSGPWIPLYTSTGQTSDARDCPARFFASGPDACFFTDSAQFAEDTILAHDYDRDDWTITDLYAAMQEAGKS